MKKYISCLNLVFVFLMFLNTSCTEPSNPFNPVVFNLEFNPNSYDANFYESGQSSHFTLTSNIGQATEFTIIDNPEYLYFEAGRLKWTKALPIGSTIAFVRAYNLPNDKESIAEVEITNLFEGDFNGSFFEAENSEPAGTLKLDFRTDGSFTYTSNNGMQSGNYLITVDNHIIFEIELHGTILYFNGSLIYDINQTPIITGDWYFDSILPENLQGRFEFMNDL